MNVILDKLKIKYLLYTLLLFFVVACHTNDNYKESLSMESVDVDTHFEAVNSEDDVSLKSEVSVNTIPKDLKIIKSATAKYKVEDVKKATRTIKRIAQKYNAYISDLRYTNDLYRKENRFTIKIPQEYFDTMMDSIGFVVDFVEYENITTKDVTEEYIDIETRLNTKIEIKERYETILRQQAKTIEEILKTEDKLRVIQEEIEAAQGRLKYLTNKVSYSTIQIDLYETVEYTKEPESYSKTFFAKGKEGLESGWSIIENFVLGLLYVWPLVIAGTVLFFVFRSKLKKRKAK